MVEATAAANDAYGMHQMKRSTRCTASTWVVGAERGGRGGDSPLAVVVRSGGEHGALQPEGRRVPVAATDGRDPTPALRQRRRCDRVVDVTEAELAMAVVAW